MLEPVLLNAMPTVSAEALAKPLPKVRSAAPVACRAILPSPRITIAKVAPRTPARTVLPALNPADAFLATNNNSSSATEEPRTFFKPKSPDSDTKPPTVAWKLWTVTEVCPSSTLNGAETLTVPTDTLKVVSTKSDPVLLKATPTDDALTEANPSPRFRSAPPVA